VTWVFAIVAFAVMTGTALALAGRWRPQGLPPGPPPDGDTPPKRFDVVLRGYRMDQVDAELARLRALLAADRAAASTGAGEAAEAVQGTDEVPSASPDPTIEP
jgi:DivIVA domain-containing protein